MAIVLVFSMKNAILIRVTMLCLIASQLHAQSQNKINTDRPDQSDGAQVLDPRKLQFETEFYYNHFTSGKPALISSSLLRYGLVRNIEARLLVEQGQERDKFISKTTQGLYPLAISTKASILKDRKILPDISIIAYLHIPVTGATENKGYWSPLFTAVLEKEFGRVTATSNISFKQEAYESKWIWQASGELKYEVSEKVSLFGEYFAQYDKEEPPLHNLDGGILYYINPGLMVHLAFGHTVFSPEHNYFINSGLAFPIH